MARGELGDDGGLPGPVDFFVSYTSADRPWAEWIAWELEAAGYSALIQAWDMQPGSNFVHEMHGATRSGARTIAVLSPAFLASEFCEAEWGAAFRRDPVGRGRRLIPVRVRDCDPDGLLGSVVYVDLVGLEPGASRAALLAGVKTERAKPARAPAHPGSDTGERPRRPDAGAAVFNVPVMTRTFVGREQQLEELATDLSREGVAAVTQIAAIHGLGGVGKTQLAARYARVHRGDYDVIWWLRADQPATLRADLAALAAALGLVDVDVDVDERQAVAVAAGWLERNRRWLLVFDNVTSPVAIAELVPEGAGGHVLITSRASADWRSLGGRQLTLDVWEREESRTFLRARTNEQEEGVLDEVADALGDLPLALEQAAAYANAKAISLASYVHRLRDRAPELFELGEPPRYEHTRYEHTTGTVWTLAFGRLAEQPPAREMLAVCAYLAPERIPLELLMTWADLANEASATERDISDAIELMFSFSLVTADVESTLRISPALQRFEQSALGHAERQQAITDAVRLLAAVLPERPGNPDGWPMYERMVAHALVATGHAVANNTALEDTARVLQRLAAYQRARATVARSASISSRARSATLAPSARVFLCHSSADKDQVRELYRRLVDDGFDPWLDEKDLLPGEPWESAIRRAVRASDFVLVCLSGAATTRAGYVHKEIKEALDVADSQPDGAIFVIPGKLEECEVPERLRHLHWIDLSTDVGYWNLTRALTHRLPSDTR